MLFRSYLASIYCVIIIVVGNYILLNLFLAILLDHFADAENSQVVTEAEVPLIESHEEAEDELRASDSLESTFGESESSVRDVHIQCSHPPSSSITQDSVDSSEETLTGLSLFVFSPSNSFRQVLNRVVQHKAFEQFVIVIILCSSVMLALESPSLERDSMLGQVIAGSDFIFVLLFGIEALMKIIVSGFWFNGPRSYLRDKWNVLDFFVLCVGIVFQFGSSFDQLKSLRALRALRCLKPLRLATRNKGLKVVITSLFQSIPPLLNVALVCLLFFLTFAILGISLLKVASFISKLFD